VISSSKISGSLRITGRYNLADSIVDINRRENLKSTMDSSGWEQGAEWSIRVSDRESKGKMAQSV
jgi:hypothetical protein